MNSIDREQVLMIYDSTVDALSPAVVAGGVVASGVGVYFHIIGEKAVDDKLASRVSELTQICDSPAVFPDRARCLEQIPAYIEETVKTERPFYQSLYGVDTANVAITVGLGVALLGAAAKIFDRRIKRLIFPRKPHS